MKLSRPILALALLAGLLLLAAGPGTRSGFWHFTTGFAMLRWAAWAGFGAAVLAAVSLLRADLRRTQAPTLVVALLVGLAVGAVPLYWQRSALSVPPIHDISTDLEDPPAFAALAPMRAQVPNGLGARDAVVDEAQREAYPEVQPLHVALAPDRAFEVALAAAREMGWQIAASDPAIGRIEATATTFWFGFEDDVVVRVNRADDGSRIDLRSVSRVGRGDAGANAARIRRYLETYTALAADSEPARQ